MTEGPGVRDGNPATPSMRTKFKFGLMDLVSTVVLVAVGLALVRAMGQTPNGSILTAACGLLYLPLMSFGWLSLWSRPIQKFQGARHWLLVGFFSGALVALIAIVAAFSRIFHAE
jgi:hypothetical protein